MAWYHGATKRVLRFANDMPARQPHKAVELHTNGGGTDHGSLFGWFNRPGNDIAAHFQVMASGHVEQYIDAAKQAYAEFAGNAYCIAVETEDGGHPERRWTPEQLASIIAICKWVGCPPRELRDGPSDGVGWHSQYADNDRSGHACPGPVRVQQIIHEVIPALEPRTVDWRPLKREAVAIGKQLHLPTGGVDVGTERKGGPFVCLLCKIAGHKDPGDIDYRHFKRWLVAAANGLHLPHDQVDVESPRFGVPAARLTIAVADHH